MSASYSHSSTVARTAVFRRDFSADLGLLCLCLLLLLACLAPVLPAAAQELDPASPEAAEQLLDAASRGDLDEVRALLAAGVDPNITNAYNSTALFRAADKGHLDIAELLIEKGADVNIKDSFYNATPLTWAFMNQNLDVAELVLKNGFEDRDGALGTAVAFGATELVDLVLEGEGLSRNGVQAAIGVASRGEEPDAELLAKLQKALEARPPSFSLDAEQMARYEGYYQRAGEGSDVVIEVRDGELVAEFQNEDKATTRLDADSTTAFNARDFGIPITFELEGEAVKGFGFPTRGGTTESFARLDAPPAEAVAEEGTADDGTEVAEADGDSAGSEASEPAAEMAEMADEAEAVAKAETKIPEGAVDRNWPAFRGPNAAGTAKGDPPTTWDLESGENVLWKTAIPGRAHSSPVIWGDRMYLTTAVPGKDEGEFRNGLYGDVDSVQIDYDYTWRVLALDTKTGEILWDEVAHRGRPRSSHHIKATQANPTPVTDGEHVVAMMGSEGLYCYGKDGSLKWKKDLGALHTGWFYDASYQWGHSSSPILHDGKVIVQVDRHGDPFIAAYALDDGKELWRTERDNLPSWGTPTLFGSGENVQVVTNGSHFIRGYDVDTGEEVWQMGPNSEVTVGTPVVGNGLVYVTGGYPPVRPIYAIEPGAEGDLTLPDGETSGEHVAWANMTGGTYMPTPLFYGDQLYTLANNGVLGVYDGSTGERLFRARVAERGGTAFTASPVAANGRLYIASEDGDVYVVKHGSEYELLATNALNEVIMASPAIAGDVLYVRTLGHVVALGEPADGGEGETASR